ncbi:MAG: hypothetical protein MJ231_01920 [bacterium]|nr:hypothetical protein [bacterium]
MTIINKVLLTKPQSVLKKVALTCAISSLALLPAKAQKPVQKNNASQENKVYYDINETPKGYLVSETGMAGNIDGLPKAYYGVNYILPTGKNNLDIFAGGEIDKKGNANFLALIINNYKWTKNLSTWIRGVFSASDKNVSTTLQVAPIKGNVDVGKFNFALAPAYVVSHDFKTNTTVQSPNAIIQTAYNPTKNDQVFVEYNIPMKSNASASYMLTWLRKF